MNREIRFRAWDKVNGKMLDHDEVCMVTAGDYSAILLDAITFGGDDDYILMQWTGLKDADGVEIYEGDIVEGVDGIGEPVRGGILYRAEWGRIIIDPNLTLTAPLSKKLRVIGNVHEGDA